MSAGEEIAADTQTTYSDYNKLKTIVDLGYFLEDYVVEGGAVTKDVTQNNYVNVTEIVASLDDDVTRREAYSFRTGIANATYYLDYQAGDFKFGTAHPSGSYLPVAEVTTDVNKNVLMITDRRGTVGGLRLRSDYGLFDYMRYIPLLKRLQNGEVTRIKLIGDSITEGYGSTGHVNLAANTNNGNPVIFDDGAGTKWYEALYTDASWANQFRNYISANYPSVQFVNAGINGKQASWALTNKQYWVGNEDVVFVMLGANDRYDSSGIEVLRNNLTQFLSYVKSKCNLMIVMSPQPATDDYDDFGNRRSGVYFTTDQMDQVITSICANNNYPHISFYREIFHDYQLQNKDVRKCANEVSGPHPNDMGHLSMWRILVKKLGFSQNFFQPQSNSIFKNVLIDGNFQIAQAMPTVGTEVINPTLFTYPLFDLWKLTGVVGSGDSLPTIKHSQRRITDSGVDNTVVPGSKYCYRINVSGPGVMGNSAYTLLQPIEKGVKLYYSSSKGMTKSFWGRSSIPGKKIRVALYIHYGTGGTPSNIDFPHTYEFTLTNTWRNYEISFATLSTFGKTFGTNNDDFIGFEIQLAGPWQNFVAAGDIEITEMQLTSIESPSMFFAKTFEEELADCMKFFEKSYSYDVPVGSASNPNSCSKIVPSNTVNNFQSYGSVEFKVKKRTTNPVVTVYSTITANTSSQVTNGDSTANLGASSGVPYSIGDGGFGVRNQIGSGTTTVGNLVQFHWVSDARR